MIFVWSRPALGDRSLQNERRTGSEGRMELVVSGLSATEQVRHLLHKVPQRHAAFYKVDLFKLQL